MWRGGLLGDAQHNYVWAKLLLAWNAVPLQAKVNCSAGCVLRDITTVEVCYFHSSENNASLLEHLRLMVSVEDLRQLWEDVSAIDLVERISVALTHPGSCYLLPTLPSTCGNSGGLRV